MDNSEEADREFIAQAMPAFISEAMEQIEAVESLLLELEADPGNRELLDTLFRCAHTIKGSAGIFGLHRVVDFTHHVETVLDTMREGGIRLTPAVSTLLLRCNDQIRFLVDSAADDRADAPQPMEERASLVQQLHALNLPTARVPVVAQHSASRAVAPQQNTVWTLSVRFGLDTFRNGADPLAIARYLGGMGRVLSVRCATQAVPPLASLDPESCHLGFTMELDTARTREEIAEAFSFVMDECELSIRAAESPEQRMARAIEEMPDVPRLGDILVGVGAVSQAQLHQALSEQERNAPLERPKIGSLLLSQAGVAPEVVAAALGRQQKIKESVATEDRYIRVQADRLDAVINLLGELVIAGAGAALLAGEVRDARLVEANRNMSRLIEEIRNGTLGLRMVPVGETFNRFRRVVRDTASSLGKLVDFEINGGESELDKSMVEKIADPLMHLVRNALDHGLETPQERQACAKPACGKLVLSARHETGAILIRIEDDGRGIHRERVLQRAWDRGLVELGVVPGDDAIDMLIFEPGFSTAQQVTNLSGRGVGMDVVRNNIEALRGSLKLISTPGKGLRVDIRLPLTLAIIDGFLVGIGGSKFVLPLETVVEVIEAGGDRVRADGRGRHCLELRGAVLPVVRLRTLYSLESDHANRVSIVVVQSTRGQYGVEVEALMGQQQTVIKPLGRLFKTLRGISGSSILGSGEVALILDVNSLGELVTADLMQPAHTLRV